MSGSSEGSSRQTLLTQSAFDLARRAAVGEAEERPAGDLCWMKHGTYSFQGVDEPVSVFEVGEDGSAPLDPPPDSAKARRLGASSRPMTPELSRQTATRPQRRRSPLVGRKTELAQLQTRLNAALVGECQLVLIEGDAGSGKSRLLEELDRLATARSLLVLHGRFADRQCALPYQGFCELIQDYFRAREDASSPSTPDLSDLAGDLQALFPGLSEIGALRAQGSGERRTPARKATEATYVFELFARTLTRLAGGRPLVVLLENLHAGEVDSRSSSRESGMTCKESKPRKIAESCFG